MWVKALDMLLDKLRVAGVEFSNVVAISGAGQVTKSSLFNQLYKMYTQHLKLLFHFSNMVQFTGEKEQRRF